MRLMMNDFSDQFQNNPRGQRVEHTVSRFKVIEGFSGANAFGKQSETIIGNDLENVVTVDTNLHLLACGHYVYAGPQDIGGVCHSCRNTACIFCIRCCSRCHHIFCLQHMDSEKGRPDVRRSDEGMPDQEVFEEARSVCNRCGSILFGIECVKGVGVVFSFIFKCIHWLFSKRF